MRLFWPAEQQPGGGAAGQHGARAPVTLHGTHTLGDGVGDVVVAPRQQQELGAWVRQDGVAPIGQAVLQLQGELTVLLATGSCVVPRRCSARGQAVHQVGGGPAAGMLRAPPCMRCRRSRRSAARAARAQVFCYVPGEWQEELRGVQWAGGCGGLRDGARGARSWPNPRRLRPRRTTPAAPGSLTAALKALPRQIRPPQPPSSGSRGSSCAPELPHRPLLAPVLYSATGALQAL